MNKVMRMFFLLIATCIGLSSWAADLVRRWSFNGNLSDSVGGITATAVGSVTTDGKEYTLGGGTKGSSYLSLGESFPSNLESVTIELWATQKSLQYYSRVLKVGDGNEGVTMEWSLATYLDYDEITVKGIGIANGFRSHLAPYTLGTEFHIAVVFEKQTDGSTCITFYKQDGTTGETLKKFSVTSSTSWSFASCFSKGLLTLGYETNSEDTGAYDANASYNEVRIWNGALTEAELKALCLKGADDASLEASRGVDTSDASASGKGSEENSGSDVSVDSKFDESLALGVNVAAGFSEGEEGVATGVVWNVTRRWGSIDGTIEIGCIPHGGTNAIVDIDGKEIAHSDKVGTMQWQPFVTPRDYLLSHQVGNVTLDTSYTWASLEGGNLISYTNLYNVAYEDITQYRKGAEYVFPAPKERLGYTFTGWTPSAITSEMSGDLIVMANWKTNSYKVVYDSNGGSGEMPAIECAYDKEFVVATNRFTRDGCGFLGWSTSKEGLLDYIEGECVSNLTAKADGLVTLYAVWKIIPPVVRDVKVTPLPPWGIAIDYTLDGVSEANSPFQLFVTAEMDGTKKSATELAGDLECKEGKHRVYWNMAKDGVSSLTNATISLWYSESESYCVIDLSEGVNASEYPVTYLNVLPSDGLNRTEYKTTKLVLKRVDAGIFTMGDSSSSKSYDWSTVVLTKPFYMGLYEVTQKQWELVMGANPCSESGCGKGDAYPVHYVSYDMIRGSSEGAKWPTTNSVDETSFLGKLRARTGIEFDLPTEAQWEYTCRAGTETTYCYGDSADGDYMWYKDNSSSSSHEVGTKVANPWGFYDMHGNVWEWCLDWYGWSLSGGEDPVGSSSGWARVFRGGSWSPDATGYASSLRNGSYPSKTAVDFGFRLSKAWARGCVGVVDPSITVIVSNVTVGVVTDETVSNGIVDVGYVPTDTEDAVINFNGVGATFSGTNGIIRWQPLIAGGQTLSHTVGDVAMSMVLTNNENLTSLSSSLFANNTNLVAISFPSGLTNVAPGAFTGCANLKRVDIPTLVDWCAINFEDELANPLSQGATLYIAGVPVEITGSSQIEIVVQEGVTQIPVAAFSNCAQLVSIELPEGLVRVERGMFEGCSSLKSIMIPSTVEDLGDNDFREIGVRAGLEEGLWVQNGWVLGYIGTAPAELEIPEGVKGIAAYAFEDQYLLEKVTLPSTLVSIEKEAFRRCTNLESVDLPEGVVFIGDGAFQDCTYVKEVSLPSTLRHVGSSAFANTTSLGKVAFMDGIEDIGDAAFSNSWRMISISLPTSVTNIGENAFWNCKNLTGVTMPTHLMPISELFPAAYSNLTAISISEGETMMVSNAFAGCVALEGIAVPNTVANIPECAFENCGALKKVDISAAVTNIGARAFAGCSGIGEIEFPDELRTIGENAFEGLTLLEEIVLPEGLEELGENAFTNCAAIRSVTIPGGVCSLKSVFSSVYSKLTSVTITTNTTMLCRDFLHDCSSLTSIEIPEAVTNIGAWAFSGCSGLTEITFPDGLQTIEDHAFFYCSGLTEIIFPDGLQTIGSEAFSNCGRISKITFPEGLQLIGNFAFSSLYALTDVDIPRGVTSIGYCAFGWCRSVRRVTMPGDVCRVQDVFYNCGGLLEVNVTAGTTHLVDGFYEGCSGLTEVGIPAGITEIGTGLFRGCSGLTRVALPDGLTSLPDDTFTNCTSLASIVIPVSVTNVGARVFSGCTSLKSVQFLGDAPTVAALAYAGVQSDLVTYVTDGSRGWDGIAMSKALPETWPSDASNAIKTWEPKKMTVTFDAQGGEPAITNLEEVTDTTYRLPEIEPTRVGATFAGWWSEIKAGAEVRPTTRVVLTGDHTFYAHWDFHQYTIAFDANGGAGEMTSVGRTVGDGEKELPRSIFKRVDYDFAGWAMEPEGAIVFEDEEAVSDLTYEDAAVITLYAVWTERTWTARDYLGRPEGVTFAEVSDVPWVRDLDVTADGDGSMRSGAIGAADEGKKNETMLTASVVGEGQVSFQWKVSCEPSDEEGTYFDYVAFAVDGAIVAQMAGVKDWAKVTYAITGAGEHTLTWTFVRDDYDEDETLYENAAWVDELVWKPNEVVVSFDLGGIEGTAPAAVTNIAGAAILLPDVSALGGTAKRFTGWSDGAAVYAAGDSYVFGSADVTLTAQWEAREWTLAEALDAEASGLVFTTGGDAAWVVDFATNHTGAAAIRSGAITHSQTSWVETTVEGPGKLSFWMRIYGERYRNKDCDVGTCTLDGTQVYSAATNDWTNIVVTVTGAGTHTIRWAYTKNASRTAEYDCAWLDEVVWTAQASSEAFPAVSDDTGVSSALEGAKDTRLSERIKTAAEYATFKTWVDGIAKEDLTARKAVKDSELAWFAYALDLSALPEEAPTNVVISTIGTSTEGAWDLEVKVGDVEVGDGAAAADLGTVFVVEGAADLKAESFSAENVTTSFSAAGDGKVKVEVEPKEAKGQFFIRVKMTP
jgi:formylglycine-generating enzyme required for sulfatase activity